MFEEQGINGGSIETIAAAAGFTRGAFYSNFASKDELIVAMLGDHVELSIRRCLERLADHKDPADFIAAFRDMTRSRQDPLGRSPLLHMEMILFVARAEKRRRPQAPSLGRLRPGEIPGIRADGRQLATILIVLVSVLATLAALVSDSAASNLILIEGDKRTGISDAMSPWSAAVAQA